MVATRSNISSNELGLAPGVRYKSNIRSIEHQFDTVARRAAMTTLTIAIEEIAADRARPTLSPIAPAGRAGGRGLRPNTRPARAVPPPSLAAPARRAPQACVAEPALSSASMRLTDRGIGAVMVVGLMIMVTALVVIGLTALRVTGPGYVPAGQSQLVGR
jgi:hypothetical protein